MNGTAMGHKPATKQRSPWLPLEDVPEIARRIRFQPPGCEGHVRHVGDGFLLCFHGLQAVGWHLSISHQRITSRGVVLARYPQWDEIVHARDVFLPADREFGLILPKAGEFVALHDTTFHLHELTAPTRVQRLAEVLTLTAMGRLVAQVLDGAS